jgi:hypothetical protein
MDDYITQQNTTIQVPGPRRRPAVDQRQRRRRQADRRRAGLQPEPGVPARPVRRPGRPGLADPGRQQGQLFRRQPGDQGRPGRPVQDQLQPGRLLRERPAGRPPRLVLALALPVGRRQQHDRRVLCRRLWLAGRLDLLRPDLELRPDAGGLEPHRRDPLHLRQDQGPADGDLSLGPHGLADPARQVLASLASPGAGRRPPTFGARGAPRPAMRLPALLSVDRPADAARPPTPPTRRGSTPCMCWARTTAIAPNSTPPPWPTSARSWASIRPASNTAIRRSRPTGPGPAPTGIRPLCRQRRRALRRALRQRPGQAGDHEPPGAKVLHAPVVDARTHCLTLADCFGQVAAWSRPTRTTA